MIGARTGVAEGSDMGGSPALGRCDFRSAEDREGPGSVFGIEYMI
jgi:hypothetical protein